MKTYDIEVTLPVTGNGKYGKRLLDFKRYGLVNIGGTSVIVKLLVGPEVLDDTYLDDWPCDVMTISSPSRYHAAKIAHYYGNLNASDADTARWFMYVDDDSMTDIAGLVFNLDRDYDHNMLHYVVAELAYGSHACEYDLLKEFGFSQWVNVPKRVPHGWECNLLSQKAMRTLLENPTATRYLKRRSEIQAGAGDMPVGFAARLCKIFPSEAMFMSKNPLLADFSLLGGCFCHIHYFAHDANPALYQLMKRLFDPLRPKYAFEGKPMALFKEHEPQCIVNLLPNGTTSGLNKPEVKFWFFEEDALMLCNKEGQPVLRFKGIAENDKYMIGESTQDQDKAQYSLRSIMGFA